MTRYKNQNNEVVAEFICSRMRFERREMQKRAATRTITVPHPWTEDEVVAIEEQILAEKPRGATPRYGEDVQVGDTIKVRCHLLRDGGKGCLLGFVTPMHGDKARGHGVEIEWD